MQKDKNIYIIKIQKTKTHSCLRLSTTYLSFYFSYVTCVQVCIMVMSDLTTSIVNQQNYNVTGVFQTSTTVDYHRLLENGKEKSTRIQHYKRKDIHSPIPSSKRYFSISPVKTLSNLYRLSHLKRVGFFYRPI